MSRGRFFEMLISNLEEFFGSHPPGGVHGGGRGGGKRRIFFFTNIIIGYTDRRSKKYNPWSEEEHKLD